MDPKAAATQQLDDEVIAQFWQHIQSNPYAVAAFNETGLSNVFVDDGDWNLRGTHIGGGRTPADLDRSKIQGQLLTKILEDRTPEEQALILGKPNAILMSSGLRGPTGHQGSDFTHTLVHEKTHEGIDILDDGMDYEEDNVRMILANSYPDDTGNILPHLQKAATLSFQDRDADTKHDSPPMFNRIYGWRARIEEAEAKLKKRAETPYDIASEQLKGR